MSKLTRRVAAQRLFAASAALALISATAHAQEAADSPINSRNVTLVETEQSQFVLVPMRRWVETTESGLAFIFVERARDDRAVYLSDDSRGVRLELDLAHALVLYADKAEPQASPLYAITSSDAVVGGWNVIYARVSSGRYLMTSPRTWVERGDDGVEFTFTEQSRDEYAINLVDASRGVRLQLDLARKLVLYADRGAPELRPLYQITEAAAITP